jgi:phospholipid/cholesterol/gamma-HCH transport system permease protein
MDPTPTFLVEKAAGGVRLRLVGRWTSETAATVETLADQMAMAASGAARAVLDVSGIERLDTLGAWVLARTRAGLAAAGVATQFTGERETQRILIDEVSGRDLSVAPPKAHSKAVDLLADVGSTVVDAGRDVVTGVSFLGSVVVALSRAVARPSRFRGTSMVHHLEAVGLRSVPIIALISFLVGCIVAQQGIFQLSKFGATAFVVDLTGILSLRELGVLLAAIMIAGRSGSAFTAEIGSMKMREEIDALRVMGLDPIEVLVVPRIVALMIALPMLTFVADMAALFGSGVVAWIYGGISQEVFLSRLRGAIGINTFLVGLIKAPFMALIIGMIACIEGLEVKGSAESLGRQVTASVVKSIFMVIVVDGLFAMFFAAIKY